MRVTRSDALVKKSPAPDLGKAGPHRAKELGTDQIQSLLRDLDLQTSAAENGGEPGSDLPSGKLAEEGAVTTEAAGHGESNRA